MRPAELPDKGLGHREAEQGVGMTQEAVQAAKPAATPQTSLVEVTPEMAAFFMEKNTRNRVVRPKVVEAYARTMKAGGWQITGEAIKFDTQGNLIDGQHRCAAIIAANVPVTLTVIRGLNPETQAVMDSGVKRQVHDYLGMNGMKNSAVVAAIARLQLKLDGLKTVTNAEVIQWVEDNPQIVSAGEIASAFRNNIDLHTSVLGVSWMRLYELEPERAKEFFETIAAHKTDGYGDPRNALIRRMTTARRQSERITQEAQLSMVYRAWNALMSGEELFKLQAESRYGVVRIPEPVPFGTKPRTERTAARRGRKPTVAVTEPTDKDYEEFNWPTPETVAAQN